MDPVWSEVGGGSSTHKVTQQSFPTACLETCFQGCFEYACQEGCYWFTNSVINYHTDLIDNKENNWRIVSLDFGLEGGYGIPSAMQVIPRVRGNWGLLATDFRYYLGREFGNGFIADHSTLDWQVLMYNIVPLRTVNLRVGMGFSYDISDDLFNLESSAALNLYLIDEIFAPKFEFRHSWSTALQEVARWEGSGSLDFLFLDGIDIQGYLGAGARFQRFHQTTDQWALTGGVRFNLN